MSEHCKIQI